MSHVMPERAQKADTNEKEAHNGLFHELHDDTQTVDWTSAEQICELIESNYDRFHVVISRVCRRFDQNAISASELNDSIKGLLQKIKTNGGAGLALKDVESLSKYLAATARNRILKRKKRQSRWVASPIELIAVCLSGPEPSRLIREDIEHEFQQVMGFLGPLDRAVALAFARGKAAWEVILDADVLRCSPCISAAKANRTWHHARSRVATVLSHQRGMNVSKEDIRNILERKVHLDQLKSLSSNSSGESK